MMKVMVFLFIKESLSDILTLDKVRLMQEDNIVEVKNAIVPTESVIMPGLWQRVAFWSVFPAIIYAPFWFAAGRSSFGIGGWMGLFTTMYAVVIILPYQLIIMTITLMGKKRYLSRRASWLLFLYYALLVTFEISLVDGGDTTASIGSVLTLKGVPELFNNVIFGVSLSAGVVVMVALIIVMIIDVTRNRRAKPVEIKTQLS